MRWRTCWMTSLSSMLLLERSSTATSLHPINSSKSLTPQNLLWETIKVCKLGRPAKPVNSDKKLWDIFKVVNFWKFSRFSTFSNRLCCKNRQRKSSKCLERKNSDFQTLSKAKVALRLFFLAVRFWEAFLTRYFQFFWCCCFPARGSWGPHILQDLL